MWNMLPWSPNHTVCIISNIINQSGSRHVCVQNCQGRGQHLYPQKMYNLVKRKGRKMSPASQVKYQADQLIELVFDASLLHATYSIAQT